MDSINPKESINPKNSNNPKESRLRIENLCPWIVQNMMQYCEILKKLFARNISSSYCCTVLHDGQFAALE